MGAVRIVSRSGERFTDRREAGRLLAVQLGDLRGRNTVVLGIPRGGLLVAQELAEALGAELDVVLSHKLRAPGHPELALGSVAEDGSLFLNPGVLREVGVAEAYIEQERTYQMAEIARRREALRAILPRAAVTGRQAIVTDDGVATGATFQAALWAVRQQQPDSLIAAIPVAPEETVRMLARDADETICLRAPPYFVAVGQFYMQFGQVSDNDVEDILRREAARRGAEQQ